MLKRIVVALALLALGTQAQADAVGPRLHVNTYMDDNQIASSVAAFSGGFVATWASDEQDGSDVGIYAQMFRPNGVRFGKEFQVNTTTKHAQTAPSIAALTNGGFVVTWYSLQVGGGFGIYGQRYTARGAGAGGEFRINTKTSGDQTDPSIAALSDGGFVVIWLSYARSSFNASKADIVGRRYRADGVPVGVEFMIASLEQEEFASGPPQVAGLGGGGFVVTWVTEEKNRTGVFGRRYGATGAASGPAFRVVAPTISSFGLASPAVAGLKNGSFVITWSDSNSKPLQAGTFGQRYTPHGVAFGAKFKINTAARSTRSRVAALSDGGFVVSYLAMPDIVEPFGVYGRRYTASGKPVGTEFSVGATESNSDRDRSAVAGLRDGGFVILWEEDEGAFSDSTGIFGQRFNP